jgi:probable addiction module antidote protein
MALKTTRWDVADILKTKEALAAYLDAALEDWDPELLKDALGAIARSKGMTDTAKEAGLWPVEPLPGVITGRKPGVRDRRQRP